MDGIGQTIQEDAAKHQEAFAVGSLSHAEILELLLEEVTRVDFLRIACPEALEREELRDARHTTGPDGQLIPNPAFTPEQAERLEELNDRKLTVNQKQMKVIVVDELQKVAKRNRWNLCQNHGFVYLYNGCYWKRLDKDELESFLGKVARKMGVNWIDAKEATFKRLLLEQFFSDAQLSRPIPTNGQVLINFQNGTLEINKGKHIFRGFNPTDFLTHQLPFAYDPKATAPKWSAFLNEVLPDVTRQMVLAEFLGHVFVKDRSLKPEKALLLLGEGANGKSVCYEVTYAVFGGSENVSGYSLETLSSVERGGSARANIDHKLINYGSELSTRIDPNQAKALISGEPIEARQLYQQPYMMEDYAKLMFNCNQLPKDTEQTNAFFRRFIIIPFDVIISEGKQDKGLAVKIINSELPGVFNWIMQGLERYLEQKGHFTDCEAAQKQLEQYRLESDSVKMFLHDNGYTSCPEQWRALKELYTDYRAFCIEDGFKPVQKTNFKKRLINSGILVDGRINRVYLKQDSSLL